MTCERVEALLSALIDQELDTPAETEIRHHLETCPTCAETLRDLRLLVETSAQLEPVAPPDRLYGDIRREIRQLQHRPRFAPFGVGWVLIPALATAVLMLVVFPRHDKAPERSAQSAPLAVTPEYTAPGAELTEPVATPTPTTARRARSAARTSSAARPASRAPSALVQPAVATMPVGSAPLAVARSTAATPVVNRSRDVRASLREVQQALEEIEAALHRNPGNPQVLYAYQTTYAKGVELRDRYLAGTR